MEFDIASTIEAVLLYGTAAIGAASLIVQGLKKIAKVTPSQKDDLILGKVEAFLVKVVSVMDRVALNPSKDDARP